jgi:ParB family chromosome partitioning protein
LKKGDMACEAARLLDGAGWLPEPLRLAEIETVEQAQADEPEALPDFLAGEEEEAATDEPDQPQPHSIAAE